MSIQIMTEVWQHATVSQGTLLVLLALADSADERSRECWPAVASIAAKARVSERQVQRCLTELREAGIITVKPNAGRAGTNVFCIAVVTKWRGDKMSGGDAHVTGGVTPMSGGGVTPMSPEPSLRTINEPSIDVREDLFDANEVVAPKTDRVADAFKQFWAVYPVKTGKPAALKNFCKAVKGGVDPDEIIVGARKYRDWIASAVPGEFRPQPKNPQGWITDERWNDEVLKAAPPPRRPGNAQWGEVVR